MLIAGPLPRSAPPDRARYPVALVCMPFYGADRPSIQIGLLGAIARQRGYGVETHHLNLELADRLGPTVYQDLCNLRGPLTGEWLFSVAAFGAEADGDAAFFEAFPDEIDQLTERAGLSRDDLARLRNATLPDFVDWCARAVDWSAYRCVGFTSTFQQNVASLALARRIKAQHPDVVVVFGGANFEGDMGAEMVRAFPFADYAVVGEGDTTFPDMLDDLAAGRSPVARPGVAARNGDGSVHVADPEPTNDLDPLPVPDYHEYFERAQRLGLADTAGFPIMVPIETARGCWWGQKHHCTFCGLNGLTMGFRAKTPDRVLDELAELSGRHGHTFFEAVDNILEMPYLRTLFPRIAERRDDFTFFYEVKANLTRSQLATLHAGGVRWIQPGIESLSTNVLGLMRKGTTMLKNVRLLKWARYYRIKVGWNIIYGFPGETAEDYRRQLEVARLLGHLEPPNGIGRIWLERYSPNFFEADEHGIENIRPERSYSLIYPDHLDLEKAAYFFDYDTPTTLPDDAHAELRAWVDAWSKRWEDDPDQLLYRRAGSRLFIDELRRDFPRGTYSFDGWIADIYEHCSESMRDVESCGKHLAARGHQVDLDHVDAALHEFCERGLMVGEDGSFLSLALPANPNYR